MPILDFQAFLLPVLKELEDGQIHTFREVIECMAQLFQVSNAERKERLPSGRYGIFDSRVGWAKTYLKKAGLLTYPKRATLQITERGLQVLAEDPQTIDIDFLKQFNEFTEFVKNDKTKGPEDSEDLDIQPEDITTTNEPLPRVWWVNQGKNLDVERAEGYITAPVKGKDGRKVSHWESLKFLKPQDIVLHYSQGMLRYISRVVTLPWVDSGTDGEEQRFVSVTYQTLNPPILVSRCMERLIALDMPVVLKL
jgi:hypothetical protein